MTHSSIAAPAAYAGLLLLVTGGVALIGCNASEKDTASTAAPSAAAAGAPRDAVGIPTNLPPQQRAAIEQQRAREIARAQQGQAK